MATDPTPYRRRPTERFGTREYEPYDLVSLAGGLDRSVRRSVTDPGKWWEGEGFATESLAVVKTGGLRQITPRPLSSVYQGIFERGAAFYVTGTVAYWDLFGFDLLGLIEDGTDPASWVGQFDFKLSRDPESHWTEVDSVAAIYEVTFTNAVAPAYQPGEAFTGGGMIGVIIDYDPVTEHAWLAKGVGAVGSDPSAGDVITGTVSGAVETIATATATGAVRIHFAGAGYPTTEFGSPTARSSAGADKRARVQIRRRDASRSAADDLYVGESAPVQNLLRFIDATDQKHLLMSTPYQTYQCDGRPVILDEGDCRNPSYRVGLAGTNSTTAVAFGGGTNLLDTAWPGAPGPDWLFKLVGDPETHWTPVKTIDSATSLTLRWAYPNTTVAAAYRLVRRWQASSPPEATRLRVMRSHTWVHSLPERLALFYNGVDPVMKWRPGIAATGNSTASEMQPLVFTGLTTPVDWARYAVSFKEHLVLAHYKQGATVHNRGIIWSDARNCQSWRDTFFRDIDFQDDIQWIEQFRDTMIVFGRKNIVCFRYLGDPFYFGIQSRHEGVGTIAGGSVQNDRDQSLIFLGKDDVYSFDGIRPERIGQPIWDVIKPLLNHAALPLIASFMDETRSRYYLSIPTTRDKLGNHLTVCFDMVERTWTQPFLGLSSFATYERSDEGFIDEDDGIIDSDDSLIDSLEEEEEITFVGDAFGSVYELEGQLSQDGADIFSRLSGGLTHMGVPAVKKLGWVHVEGTAPTPLQMYVLLSMNGKVAERSGPYVVRLDETPTAGRQGRFDRRIWVNKRAKYFGLEFVHDHADESPVIDSATLFYRTVSLR